MSAAGPCGKYARGSPRETTVGSGPPPPTVAQGAGDRTADAAHTDAVLDGDDHPMPERIAEHDRIQRRGGADVPDRGIDAPACEQLCCRSLADLDHLAQTEEADTVPRAHPAGRDPSSGDRAAPCRVTWASEWRRGHS